MRHIYALTPCLLLPLLPLTFSAYAESEEEKKQQPVERIQVTGQVLASPAEVIENTKAPRQPVPAHDGAEYLNGITGFHSVRKGGSSADPVFRGLSGSRIAILGDGAPLLGGCPSRMDPPTAYISPQSFDQIVVTKGPYRLNSGPPATAATVNFQRQPFVVSEPGISGFISSTLAQANRTDVNTELTAQHDQGFIRLNATHAESDHYKDGNGDEVHSRYKRWSSQLTLGHQLTPQQFLEVSAGLGDGYAAYADRTMDGTSFYRRDLAAKWSMQTSWSILPELNAHVYWSYIDHIMDNYTLRPDAMMKSAHNPDRYTRGFALSAQLTPHPQHQLELGVDGMRNEHRGRMSMNIENQALSGLPRTTDATFEQLGVFVEGTYQAQANQRFLWGARLDDWQTTDRRQQLGMGMMSKPNPTANSSQNESLHSLYGRYEWQSLPTHSTWFVGIGQTERFPDYWELFARGRRSPESASAFLTRSEQLQQIDIGLIQKFTNIDISATLFANQTDDFILIEVTPMAEVVRNIDARSIGFEFDAEWRHSNEWISSYSISYVRGENRSDQLPLAQQPSLSFRAGLSYTTENMSFGGQFRAAQGQHRIALNQGTIAGIDTRESSGYGIFSVNGSWKISSTLQINFGIDNIFDRFYSEHLSRSGADIAGFVTTDVIPEPGRTAWLYANFTF
ncbi:TonB-dependent copper receptor [Aliidiomarina celeris]|uniref:TonB-dependent copper receptor n=1 Tax=Aliidiomarina celeris TaxID=2249428 RepID=UPI000DE88AC7|nr:TonB-dependent copper receptor [Aliidiomarina celeris]